MNICAENSTIELRKTIETIKKAKNWFLENNNKISTSLERKIKKIRHRMLITEKNKGISLCIL